MTNSDIIKFLTSKIVNAGFIDKLKIKYRPLICPFIDLINYAKNEKSVFDIGCGSGQFCSLIAKYTGVSKIMGIEINKRLVNNANQVNEEFRATKLLKFEVFDGKNIPDEINEYDLIYMIDIYHHIPPAEQEGFMSQLYKKMKPRAKLIFKDINAGSPLVICNKMHDLFFSKEIGNEIPFNKGKEMLTKIGFKINSSFQKTVFVYPHFLIICEK